MHAPYCPYLFVRVSMLALGKSKHEACRKRSRARTQKAAITAITWDIVGAFVDNTLGTFPPIPPYKCPKRHCGKPATPRRGADSRYRGLSASLSAPRSFENDQEINRDKPIASTIASKKSARHRGVDNSLRYLAKSERRPKPFGYPASGLRPHAIGGKKCPENRLRR
jgi:hypothetical protein